MLDFGVGIRIYILIYKQILIDFTCEIFKWCNLNVYLTSWEAFQIDYVLERKIRKARESEL